MFYKLKLFLVVTGLWVALYFVFRFIFKLFTENEGTVLFFFFLFVIFNWLFFPAAYYYVYEGILQTMPVDFLFTLSGADLIFITAVFLIAGPFGLYINIKYLLTFIS